MFRGDFGYVETRYIAPLHFGYQLFYPNRIDLRRSTHKSLSQFPVPINQNQPYLFGVSYQLCRV